MNTRRENEETCAPAMFVFGAMPTPGRPGRGARWFDPDDPGDPRRFGRRPPGPKGGGSFGGGPRGGGPGGRGRARRGQIRTALLALLAEAPMHGYEMIRTLDERSGGRWRPSPGAVYPTLSQLEDEGLIEANESDGKRVFRLTEPGREAAESLAAQDREPWAGDDVAAGFELRGLVAQLGHAVRGVAMGADASQQAKVAEVLVEARRSIYRILADEPTADSGDEGGDDPDGIDA